MFIILPKKFPGIYLLGTDCTDFTAVDNPKAMFSHAIRA